MSDEFGSWHPENWDVTMLMWLKHPEGAKDLRLLQAAPSLLEACEELILQIDTDTEVYRRATAAIAKARGITHASTG